MSEVIVRMEMPKGCADCKLPKLSGNCPIPYFRNGQLDNEYWVYRERAERPSWCPIVGELPEQHGMEIIQNANNS